jgi:hypothetical protein
MNSEVGSSPTFSSDGFDLDAASGSEDVILEVGGGSSKVEVTNVEDKSREDQPPTTVSAIAKSEEFKELGNQNFKVGAYLEAYDMYTEAIEACPGMNGDQLLKEKQEFDEMQHEIAVEQQRKFDTERRAAKTTSIGTLQTSHACVWR